MLGGLLRATNRESETRTLDGPRGVAPRNVTKGAAVDFVVAAALIGVFAVAAYLSVQMERPRGWLSAPGLVPFLLSITLIAMFSVIAGKAIQRGALIDLGRSMRLSTLTGLLSDERRKRVTLAAGIIALYYFLLLAFLPFEISTVAFFLLIFSVFWADSSWTRRIVTSVGVTAAFTVGFRGFFGIILPGEGDLLGTVLYWFNN